MNTALETLTAKGPPTSAAIDAFVQSQRFPLIEPDQVTFVYRGEADRVSLHCWIAGLDASQAFDRIEETDLWAATISLPRGSRIEYKFDVVEDGVSRLITDPLNDLLAHDPFGANSVCQAHGYRRPSWSLPKPQARSGVIEQAEVMSRHFGGPRRLHVYLPARLRRRRRYPLLVVHDGEDYLRYASLQTVLDNLMHALEIPPMIVALTQSPDRNREYAADPRHADFLVEELVPHLGEHFPLIDRPQARCLMGASFGAVASLHTAWRHPGAFGRLLLQSGSYAFSDLGRHRRGAVFDPVVTFMNQFRADPGVPAERVYLSCGIYESLIYENRSLVPLLQAQGIDLRFEESRDAHNWENWRDRLRHGLSWLMPGPVWLVYE